MIFRLGLNELKKNIFINMLCCLQLTVIFTVVTAMISSVVSRFEKYIPFKNELNQKGIYLQADQMLSVESENNPKFAIDSREAIKNDMGLTKVKDVFCICNVWTAQSTNTKVIAYDYDTVSKFTPEMKSGRWLSDKNNIPDGAIAGVISENNDNIDTGDIIEINEAFTDEPVKVYIVGKIADGASIIETSQAENNSYTFDNLYWNYDFSIEEKPLIIVNYEELKNTGIPFITQVRGSVIINYEDDISEKEEADNYNAVMRNGNLFYGYSSLEDMNENSRKYIYFEVLRLLPMIISIFILTAITVLSISAVNAKIRIKTYAIYYICGMQWGHIIGIEMVKSAVIVAVSALLAFISSICADEQVIFGGLVINNGFYQFIGCAFVGALFILLSAAFPFIITRNEKPVTVFHSN